MVLTAILLTILLLLVGWLLDYFFGDPENLPHPIVWFGKWIAWGERNLNHGAHRVLKGALFAMSSVLLTFFLTQSFLHLTYLLARYWTVFSYVPYAAFLLYMLVASVLVFYCLAGHTLRKEVRMVFEAVDRSVEEGRAQVARIVGRDTQTLSAQEVRTAALETLAENLSDGVVAPLFWYLLLGVPGMLAYKMVNTLDSMIGYKTARYKDFGCWAAQMDDVANYLPARITALLILCYFWLMQRRGKYLPSPTSSPFTFKEGWAFVRQYGPQHASPNSGWPEAALAYILNCRFGGTHDYFGEEVYKPYIGHNPRLLNTYDMNISIATCFGAECLMLLIVILLSFI